LVACCSGAERRGVERELAQRLIVSLLLGASIRVCGLRHCGHVADRLRRALHAHDVRGQAHEGRAAIARVNRVFRDKLAGLVVDCIGIAQNLRTKQRWWEAEVHRVAGEIALRSPEPNAAKAQAYFQRALVVARQQQAKSWELHASMSLARLWRDQGKVQQARELLAPVYGWFTEGFDTRDLKAAKALLEELAS
jgi:hypothetical protein